MDDHGRGGGREGVTHPPDADADADADTENSPCGGRMEKVPKSINGR